jgi:hypothetical protein
VSQNTHLGSTAPDDPVSVRALATPTRREIGALADIFDRYRAHYGDPHHRRPLRPSGDRGRRADLARVIAARESRLRNQSVPQTGFTERKEAPTGFEPVYPVTASSASDLSEALAAVRELIERLSAD